MSRSSSAKEHVLATPTGRQLAHVVSQRPESKTLSKVLFAQTVCTSSKSKRSPLPAAPAQRQVHLTRAVVEQCGLAAECKACGGGCGPRVPKQAEKVVLQITKGTSACENSCTGPRGGTGVRLESVGGWQHPGASAGGVRAEWYRQWSSSAKRKCKSHEIGDMGAFDVGFRCCQGSLFVRKEG